MDIRRLRFISMFLSRMRNILYLLCKGKFRNAYSYLWSSVFTRDSGIALFDPIWRLFPFLTPYPEAIEIEPTTRCHLLCNICEHTYWQETPKDLSFEDFKKIINQFPRLKWIGTTGIGSSFLNKDFLKMLGCLKEKGVYIEMFDTFDLITPDLSENLINLSVDKVWLSCEASTKKTYEKIRVGASFEKTMTNVRAFLALKKERRALLPELWFHFIINSYNFMEMADFVDMVAGLVKGVPNAATLIFYSNLMEFKEVMPYKVWNIPEDIRREVYKRAHRHGIYINWNENITRLDPPCKCTKWNEPFILSSGHLQPCCVINEANERQFQRDNAFLNVLEGNFYEFWHSEKFKEFIKLLRQNKFPKVCKNCKVYKIPECK
ncbi:MAG: SPASM domain-containing protein [Candidatus Omnitrophota bacterium]